MSLIIDGVIVADGFQANATDVYRVYAEGSKTLVFDNIPEGVAVFSAVGSDTFTVPAGVTEVTICMCGGGGSGAHSITTNDNVGGGSAGQVVSQVVAVTAGQNISVTVGGGGASQYGIIINDPMAGNAGGSSAFGAITASGGAGGTKTSYLGNGGNRTTCGGTRSNGLKSSLCYGGQAGAFGNGGNGHYVSSGSANGGNGGIGAGGGAGRSYYGSSGGHSGSGGRGQIIVTWTPFNATWSGSTTAPFTNSVTFQTSGSLFRVISAYYGPGDGVWHSVNVDGTFPNNKSVYQNSSGTGLDFGGFGNSTAPNTISTRRDGTWPSSEMTFDTEAGFSGNAQNGSYTSFVPFWLESSGGLIRAQFATTSTQAGAWISLT